MVRLIIVSSCCVLRILYLLPPGNFKIHNMTIALSEHVYKLLSERMPRFWVHRTYANIARNANVQDIYILDKMRFLSRHLQCQ